MEEVLSLTGNLGTEPEMRYTSEGKSVVTFSLAAHEQTARSGVCEIRTTWYRCVVAGEPELVETAAALHKGARVEIEGVMRTRSWRRYGHEESVAELHATRLVPRFRSGAYERNAGAVAPTPRSPLEAARAAGLFEADRQDGTDN
jgi:single stranded DNA-binding protein